jgi:hypothetical protein
MKTATLSETTVCVSCSLQHHIPQGESHICSSMRTLSLEAMFYEINYKLINNVKLLNVL